MGPLLLWGGGMQGGSKDCTGRTSTAAAHKEFKPWLPPQSSTRSKTLYRQPQLQPGTALQSGTPPLQRFTQQGKSWQRHGNVPGGAGVAYKAVEGCVRGGVTLLSYSHFSLPEPNGQATFVQESLLRLLRSSVQQYKTFLL